FSSPPEVLRTLRSLRQRLQGGAYLVTKYFRMPGKKQTAKMPGSSRQSPELERAADMALSHTLRGESPCSTTRSKRRGWLYPASPQPGKILKKPLYLKPFTGINCQTML
ncbi:MAG: hypothetical protein AAAB21_21190, partial [Pseudomonas chlororaphis]